MLWKLWCESWANASEGWKATATILFCWVGVFAGIWGITWVSVHLGTLWATILTLFLAASIPTIGVIVSGRMNKNKRTRF